MKIGFAGLGRMGSQMVERLLLAGHEVVVYDVDAHALNRLAALGAQAATSLKGLAESLTGRKVIWLMLPAGIVVGESIDQLLGMLRKDDIIIDGGNSYYKETRSRAIKAGESGIHLLDCGTSGGVWGLKNGYCLMTGGNREATDFIRPVYKSLASRGGFTYCGESGSGHFVKMIHNGVEYGMMQSLAEGLEILKQSPYDLDLTAITRTWQNGSVVRSWLLDLAVLALKEDPELGEFRDFVPDSGEGRWTVEAAMELNVPAHVITSSLFNRFQSRQKESFAMKVLAALRYQFGGHTSPTK